MRSHSILGLREVSPDARNPDNEKYLTNFTFVFDKRIAIKLHQQKRLLLPGRLFPRRRRRRRRRPQGLNAWPQELLFSSPAALSKTMLGRGGTEKGSVWGWQGKGKAGAREGRGEGGDLLIPWRFQFFKTFVP